MSHPLSLIILKGFREYFKQFFCCVKCFCKVKTTPIQIIKRKLKNKASFFKMLSFYCLFFVYFFRSGYIGFWEALQVVRDPSSLGPLAGVRLLFSEGVFVP